jgi:hypothetical protein
MLVLKRIDAFINASTKPEVSRFKEKRTKLGSLQLCLRGDVRHIGFNKKLPKEASIFAETMKKCRQTKPCRKLLFKISIKSIID